MSHSVPSAKSKKNTNKGDNQSVVSSMSASQAAPIPVPASVKIEGLTAPMRQASIADASSGEASVI
jgi:hypothetical protein